MLSPTECRCHLPPWCRNAGRFSCISIMKGYINSQQTVASLPASRAKPVFFLRLRMVCHLQLLKELPRVARVAPIPTPSSLAASVLNQGSFPPPALPGFSGTTSPSATLCRPDHLSRVSGWPCAGPRHRVSRVAYVFLVYMLSPLPRHSDGRHCLARSVPSYQPSPKGSSGRPVHRHFRGLLSVHSRYGLHTRAATNLWHASPKASAASLPPRLLRLLPAGAFRRAGLAPAGTTPPFHGAHPHLPVTIL